MAHMINRRGLGIIEVVMGGVILASVSYFAITSFFQSTSIQQDIRAREAINQVDENFRKMMAKGIREFLTAGCTASNFTSKLNIDLASGIKFRLVNPNQANKISGPLSPRAEAAKKRCLTQQTHRQASNLGGKRAFYFCLLVTPSDAGDVAQTEILAMQPIFVEVVYSPSLLTAPTQLTCTQRRATANSMDIFAYNFFWTAKTTEGDKVTKTYFNTFISSGA